MARKFELIPPQNYCNSLENRKIALEKTIKYQKAVIERLESKKLYGNIRIEKHYNQVQFYHITKTGDTNGKYIPKSKNEFARNIIELQYDKKVLKSMEIELNYIKKLLTLNQKSSVCKIFTKYSKLRQTFITPVTLTDQTYTELWQAVPYSGNSYDMNLNTYYTAKGEYVRSKSEVIIADTLNRMKIPYRYEYPLELKNKMFPIYPDFCCLNVRTRTEYYWEHFGMMDIPEYSIKAVAKINQLAENGYYNGDRTIFTFETTESPLNTKVIEEIIEHHLL